MAILALPVRPYTAGYEYDVELDGTTYHLTFSWNPRGEVWHLDIGTPAGAALLEGLVLTVDFPLLQTYRISNPTLPPGELLVVDQQGEGLEPGAEDFGERHQLLYYEADTLAALNALVEAQ